STTVSSSNINLAGARANNAGNPGSGAGFAAVGGPRTVTLLSGESSTINGTAYSNVFKWNSNSNTAMPGSFGDFLSFGSLTSDDQIIFTNTVDLNSSSSARRIRTIHGSSAVPEVKFTG